MGLKNLSFTILVHLSDIFYVLYENEMVNVLRVLYRA
jgi:hypothetical protein